MIKSIFILLLGIISINFVYANNIVMDSKAMSIIVVGADATEPERYAAENLQKYVKLISDVNLPIVSKPSNNKNVVNIIIGQTKIANNILNGYNWKRLKYDGILVRNISNNIVIAGDRPSGSIYAVYEVLESFGVRFLDPTDTKIVKSKNLSINKDIEYIPSFRIREIYYRSTLINNDDYNTALRLNGHFQMLPENKGGHYEFVGFAHTFDIFLSSQKYLSTHPEWFSERNGVRVGGAIGGQLCLSNMEMRREFLKNVLEQLKNYKDPRIVSITQNDNQAYCTCENCSELVKKWGNQSDLLIDFVNYIARGVKKVYLNCLVDTFAYQYTRNAPKTIKPDSNLMIRLCTIECDFSKSLTSNTNESFYKDIKDWKLLTKNLFVWDYVVNFANFHQPYPNNFILDDNIRFLAKNNVFGVFEQGDSFNASASMQPYKVYLLSKLLWNSNIDADKVTKEFMYDYYGNAAPYILAYMKELDEIQKKQNTYVGCFDFVVFPDANFINCFNLFEKAKKAVADDPKLLERVKIQELSLKQAFLISNYTIANNTKEILKLNMEDFINDYISLSEKTKNIYTGETVKYDFNLLRNMATSNTDKVIPPKRVVEEQIKDWSDIRIERAIDALGPDFSKTVDDSLAVYGKAKLIVQTTYGWCTQLPLNSFDVKGFQKGEVIFRVRLNKPENNDDVVQIGVYDTKTKKQYLRNIKGNEIKNNDYNEYSLGVIDLNPNEYVFIAPMNNVDKNAMIYIDRIYILKK